MLFFTWKLSQKEKKFPANLIFSQIICYIILAILIFIIQTSYRNNAFEKIGFLIFTAVNYYSMVTNFLYFISVIFLLLNKSDNIQDYSKAVIYYQEKVDLYHNIIQKLFIFATIILYFTINIPLKNCFIGSCLINNFHKYYILIIPNKIEVGLLILCFLIIFFFFLNQHKKLFSDIWNKYFIFEKYDPYAKAQDLSHDKIEDGISINIDENTHKQTQDYQLPDKAKNSSFSVLCHCENIKTKQANEAATNIEDYIPPKNDVDYYNIHKDKAYTIAINSADENLKYNPSSIPPYLLEENEKHYNSNVAKSHCEKALKESICKINPETGNSIDKDKSNHQNRKNNIATAENNFLINTSFSSRAEKKNKFMSSLPNDFKIILIYEIIYFIYTVIDCCVRYIKIIKIVDYRFDDYCSIHDYNLIIKSFILFIFLGINTKNIQQWKKAFEGEENIDNEITEVHVNDILAMKAILATQNKIYMKNQI